MPVDLAYRIRTGSEARDTVTELKSLGVEYVVVHGPNSKEYYRDFVHPERLEELPVVYREGDDTIYRLPVPRLAQSVKPEELPGKDVEPYVTAMGDAGRPVLRTQWLNTSTLVLDGETLPDHLVALQVNYDPGWHATQDGREIDTAEDRLGYLVLHATASPATHIELRYRGTREQRVMATLSALAWLLLVGQAASLRRVVKTRPGR
jgi:hypothetical protein